MNSAAVGQLKLAGRLTAIESSAYTNAHDCLENGQRILRIQISRCDCFFHCKILRRVIFNTYEYTHTKREAEDYA